MSRDYLNGKQVYYFNNDVTGFMLPIERIIKNRGGALHEYDEEYVRH